MTSSHPIRVLLADDHPIVRAGLTTVLESAPDIEVVGQCATAQEAVDMVRESLRGTGSSIDVVLMDLRFGEAPSTNRQADGVTATAAIRALEKTETASTSPHTKPEESSRKVPQVLVVTNYSSDSDIVGAITAGALGYLLKDADPSELIEGIRHAAHGQTVLNTNVASRLMGRMRNPTTALTARELEVLQLVADGLSNKKIAQQLVLTEATVKSHLVHIFGKLGVNSRTAAVVKAQERGILSQ